MVAGSDGLQVYVPDHPEVYRYDGYPETNDTGKVGRYTSELPTTPDGLKTAIPSALEVVRPGNDIEVLSRPSEKQSYGRSERKTCGLPRRTFCLVVSLLLIITIAIVLGSVLGVLMRRKPALSTPSTADPSSTTTSSSSETSSASPPPSTGPLKMLSGSKLASIAWNDTNQVTQYRLYFQDSESTIRESAWNSTGKQWYANGVIGKAKSRSAIAAAVTGPPSWPFQIYIYWINEAGYIDEWYTTDDVTWQPGGLLSSKISPSSISALSTIWHRDPNCPLCPNTRLLAYQDTSNKLNLGNLTTAGWKWTVLNANPIPGSGAAFTLTLAAADIISGIQLFYQTASGNLVSNDWSDPPRDGTAASFANWSSRENWPLPVTNVNASIAAFTYGVTDKNLHILQDILSSGPHGLSNTWWTGVKGGEWPPVQTPAVLNVVDAYTVLAANNDRRVYAMKDGVVKEFTVMVDGVSWSEVGDVSIA